MTTRTYLLIIDPQNDFCDLPEDYCPALPAGGRLAPALPVPGAHADLRRLAMLIDQGGAGLDGIAVTLDAHHRLDIGHPAFWCRADGALVAPFTTILASDVRAGIYRPREPSARQRVLAYLDALEAASRLRHTVWPVHCEIGSWGHAVHHDLRLAYNRWEESRGITVGKFLKGQNPWVEHYSAVRAEVADLGDPKTQANTGLLDALSPADRVFVGGEAGSHCVKATLEHLLDLPGYAPGKLALLADCVSPVPGFEAVYAAFLDSLPARGVDIITSATALAELTVKSF